MHPTRALGFAVATAAGVTCLFVSDNLSSLQQSGLISQADARVGRPLTPGSVAGVGRRTTRRAYRRAAYTGAGIGLGAGAYYGTRGYYGNGSGYARPVYYRTAGSGYRGNCW